MSASASLIPELEEVIQRGSTERRRAMLGRITAFFLEGASRFSEDQVRLFDAVLGRLIAEIEAKARMELSHKLAPIGNAPVGVVRCLAHDRDIAVAGPMLKCSPRIGDADLVDIARTGSQAHLLAISDRTSIPEPVTEVLVRRGDRDVVRKVVGNSGARLSRDSFTKLVDRAEQDSVLAEAVGMRPDIPAQLLRELLGEATEIVQQRLLASASPTMRAEVRQAAKACTEVDARSPPRDYAAAQREIQALQRDGRLSEAAVAELASSGRYEATIASLAAACAVPIEVADRLMADRRPDPVLILCKAAGWGWPTAKALISIQADGHGICSQDLDLAYADFDRLSPTTARRVIRFWRVRTRVHRE
jgi:uncharacterized protein (DUF2336 family)